MKNKFFILIVILLQIGGSIYSNDISYEKGNIFDLDGTVRAGYIERLTEAEISTGVNFKNAKTSKEIIKIRPGEVKGFNFDSDNFLFENIEFSKGKSAGDQEIVQRFAKKLLGGFTELYKLYPLESEYKKIIKTEAYFVYIFKKAGEFHTLEQPEVLIRDSTSIYADNPKYKVDKKYIGKLIYLTSDCNKNLAVIEKLKFSDRSMISFIKSYNNCSASEVKNIDHNYKFKSQKKYNLKLGYSTTRLPSVQSQLGFVVGSQIEILNPSLVKNQSAKIGLEYHFQTFQDEDNVKIIRNLIKIPVSGTVLRKLSTQSIAFLNFGLVMNYDLKKSNKLKRYDYNYGNSFFMDQIFGIGFNYIKYSLYFNYQSNLLDFKRPNDLFEVGILYRLHQSKSILN